MLDRIKRQPALVTGLIQSALYCATSFGLHLSDVQVASILGLSTAACAIFLPGVPADAEAEEYEPQHLA